MTNWIAVYQKANVPGIGSKLQQPSHWRDTASKLTIQHRRDDAQKPINKVGMLDMEGDFQVDAVMSVLHIFH